MPEIPKIRHAEQLDTDLARRFSLCWSPAAHGERLPAFNAETSWWLALVLRSVRFVHKMPRPSPCGAGFSLLSARRIGAVLSVAARGTLGVIMIIATIVLAAVGLVQQPAADAPEEDLAVISARLGACAADFTVKDADDQPIYAAIIHVRIRYGFLGIKRMDLEVGTDSAGQARVEGLPDKIKPLTYDIQKGDKEAIVEQTHLSDCQASYEVSLE